MNGTDHLEGQDGVRRFLLVVDEIDHVWYWKNAVTAIVIAINSVRPHHGLFSFHQRENASEKKERRARNESVRKGAFWPVKVYLR